MDDDNAYDVVILGGGGAAEAMMGVLADADVSVAVVERLRVGGECPFTGCMPSKAMLHDVATARDWDAAVHRRQEITDHLDDESHAENVRDQGATLLRGDARIDGPGRVVVDLDDGGTRTLTTTHVVLATGAAPSTLPIDGLDDVDAWTYEDLWTATERPGSMVVVGGGAIGLEAATMLTGFGVTVDVVDVVERLLPAVPAALGELLADLLVDQGIGVHLDAEIESVAPTDGGVRVDLAGGATLEAQRLLLAVGKSPRRDVGLETLDLRPDDLDVGDDMRVGGATDLWAIGDVSGHPPFTHTGNAMGEVAARNILDGGDRTVDFRHAPMVTFTDPPSVVVGSFVDDADHVTVRATYDDLARPLTDETSPGVAALCARRDDGLVVGIAGVGATLDEVSAAWALALHAEYTVADLADVMQQFPTHAEVTRLLAQRARDELG